MCVCVFDCLLLQYLEYMKTFKEIYHKERVIEETKKALQACEAHATKIKKQVNLNH